MDELEQKLEETKLQLEETKLQLTEKLGTLEQQVSDTVETASTAMAATVEAVQGTVENVTGAIEETVHNVSSVFDLRRQIQQHPFWVLGGAAVVGYIAAEYLTKPPRRYQVPAMVSFDQPIGQEPPVPPQQSQRVEPAAPQQEPAASFQHSQPAHTELSAWDSLKTMAISALLGPMQGIAMRAIPEVVGMVVGNMVGSKMPAPAPQPIDQAAYRARIWPDDLQQFNNAPSAEPLRSSKLS